MEGVNFEATVRKIREMPVVKSPLEIQYPELNFPNEVIVLLGAYKRSYDKKEYNKTIFGRTLKACRSGAEALCGIRPLASEIENLRGVHPEQIFYQQEMP